jgi:2',3'-cyclic-nucleotide 2'-phosphodiesterase (5'-nucleotidase family)
VAPTPYIVRAITGSRIPGGNLRVAFIGLTDENVRTSMNTGFQIVAPEKGLAKVIDKARSESDMVVVLAFMNPDMLKAMAPKFEGKVDAYIVAHSRAHTMAPEIDGPARYLYSRYQTKQLGVLRLYLDDKKLDRVTNDYVVLDAKLPKDPEAQQMAADSKDAIKKAQEERFNAAMINNGGTGQPADPQPAQPAQPGQSPAQPVQPAKPAGN